VNSTRDWIAFGYAVVSATPPNQRPDATGPRLHLLGVVTSAATGANCKKAKQVWGGLTVFHRYRPETTDMLQICLGGCPDDMQVEVHPGVPLVAKTVADLRALNAWSPYWVLIVPYERERPESVVTVQLW
jgi:hypothetical protein